MRVLVLSHRDVLAALRPRPCAEAMAAVLAGHARGETFMPLRSVMMPPDAAGFMGLMPGWSRGRGDGTAAFGMAGFVAVIAIARAVARKQVHHGSPFAHVVKAKIKETRTLAIDHGDAERGLGSKQSCQRFQLKAWLQINLGGS